MTAIAKNCGNQLKHIADNDKTNHEDTLMSDHIKAIEAEQMAGKNFPDFRAGDTVVVQVKVVEGTRKRLQAFEGLVIAKRNAGMNSAFTVRKISHGEGVERVFQTYK